MASTSPPSAPRPRPDRGTTAERQILRSLDAWPSAMDRWIPLADVGAGLLALSVVAPWRPTDDGPIGLIGLGRPAVLVVAVLLAVVAVPLRRSEVGTERHHVLAVGLLAALGTALVASPDSNSLPWLSIGRLLAAAGAGALVGSGFARPAGEQRPRLGSGREPGAPLTDDEADGYASRLATHLPTPSRGRAEVLVPAAVVASGLASAALFVPWRERPVPAPAGVVSAGHTVTSGAELLGTGRTAAVVAVVVAGWLLGAVVGPRRAAPLLVLSGAVAVGAVIHVGRLGLGSTTLAPWVVLALAVVVVVSALATAIDGPKWARGLAVVALLPAVAIAAGGGAPTAGREGPFTVLTDGASAAVDGLAARDVGGHGMVAWWDGDRPGAISAPDPDPEDDRGSDRLLAWTVRDGRVRAEGSVYVDGRDVDQAIGTKVVGQRGGRALYTDLEDPQFNDCCEDGYAVDRNGDVWSYQRGADRAASYRQVARGEIDGGGDRDDALPAPQGTSRIVAGDDGPLMVVGGVRLVDPRKARVVFDAAAPCGTPGAGLAPASMSELGPVVGDGDGGLWLAGRSSGGAGGSLLVHLDADGTARQLDARPDDVTSLAVNDDGALLLVSGLRLLQLDRPTDRLVELDARCGEAGDRVAGPLQTAELPDLEGRVDDLDGSLPLVLDTSGTTLAGRLSEDEVEIQPGSGSGQPIEVDGVGARTDDVVGDGAGGAWLLQDGTVTHVRADGSTEVLAEVPEGTNALGPTSAGQPPPLLGGTVRDRTVDGTALPGPLAAPLGSAEATRTRSGSVVIVSADGRLVRSSGTEWVRLVGPVEDDAPSGGPTVADVVAGKADPDQVRFYPYTPLVADPTADAVLFLVDDLLVRVGLDGQVTGLAQDPRLEGAELLVIGDDVVVLDAFGRLGRLEVGS